MKYLVATLLGFWLLSGTDVHARNVPDTTNTSEEKFIALTFDDGPDARATPALLDVLKRYGAKATFFVMGSRIEANAPLLKRMVDDGHAIGNHTLSHAKLSGLSRDAMRSEIVGASRSIQRASGVAPDVLRPPYAATNADVENIARANGLAILMWSIYPNDSSYFGSASVIAERIVASAKDGDIVFLHDTSMRSVEATERVLRNLSEKGFRFVTASQLIKRHGRLEPGATYATANGID